MAKLACVLILLTSIVSLPAHAYGAGGPKQPPMVIDIMQ